MPTAIVESAGSGGFTKFRIGAVRKERRWEENPDAHFCDVDINLHDQRHAVKNIFLYFLGINFRPLPANPARRN
jgi:hypothetical protein